MENYEDGNAGNLPFLLLSILLLNFSRFDTNRISCIDGKIRCYIYLAKSVFQCVFIYIYVKYNEDVIKD